jgi:hypothetical protein
MKVNRTGLAAILLWVATMGVFAWFFVRGNVRPGTDNRTAVVLSASERDLVLTEMRGMLSATHGILDGLVRGDMKLVGHAATSAGMAAAADVNPVLMAKLPLSFKQLGIEVHHDMDALARAAEAGRPAAELQGMLVGTLAKCVACHAAWQLNAGN